jgi:hypothetical protein
MLSLVTEATMFALLLLFIGIFPESDFILHHKHFDCWMSVFTVCYILIGSFFAHYLLGVV